MEAKSSCCLRPQKVRDPVMFICTWAWYEVLPSPNANPPIENVYSDTDPDRKMETSGSWAVRRTRKKQLCFAWPIASISCSWFFISWKQPTFHCCLPSVSSLYPLQSFPPCLSTPSLAFTLIFVNFIPLTLQDQSGIIIVNIIACRVPASVQSVTHIRFI